MTLESLTDGAVVRHKNYGLVTVLSWFITIMGTVLVKVNDEHGKQWTTFADYLDRI